MATKKKTTSVIPDEKTISSMVSEYQELKKQEKLISERKKLIADTIKAYATEKGTKDSNGSYYSENDRFVFGSQCRKSMSFDENKAVLFFQSKGYEDCISLKPMVDESAVEVRVSKGDITPEDLEAITMVKTTYAVDVREKEEAVEIQKSTATIVAQKKKPVLKRK